MRRAGTYLGVYRVKDWVAQYPDAPVYLDGDNSYQQLEGNQKALLRWVCNKDGLKIYKQPTDADQPLVNLCEGEAR